MGVFNFISRLFSGSKQQAKDKTHTNEKQIRTYGKVCPYCGGTGLRTDDTSMLPLQPRCNVCGGSGRIPF